MSYQNKIGVHYAIFADTWADDQFPLIAKAADVGFDLIELGSDYVIAFDEAEAKRVKDEGERLGMTFAVTMGLPVGLDIGSPDEQERERGKKYLTDCAKGMAKAGIVHCSGLVHSAWNGRINNLSEKAIYWENSVKSLREVTKVFEDLGVVFNVEVVNRFENFLVNTCKEAVSFVGEVESESLGIHLDTFHMNIEENSFTEAITLAGDRLNHFHIGENNRKMPGLGIIPWREIFACLNNIGYTGPISMEPFVKAKGDIAKSVSLYHDLMAYDRIEEETRQSVRFVRNLLADITAN